MRFALLAGFAAAALALVANISSTCTDVHSIPSNEQCTFIRQNCAASEFNIGYINYLELYYCSLVPAVLVPMIITSLLLSFVSLGTTASDYLCPNLYSISKFLSLSDNLAGLTLLAMGNSSADVLSTYKAISVGLVGLAISELIGAALFILTVVVGSICLLRPFKVPKHHFLRDSAFYLMVSVIITFCLIWGTISYITSLVLGLVYVLYVLVAIYSHSWIRNAAREKMRTARIRSNFDHGEDLSLIESDYADNLASLPSIEVLATECEDDKKVTEELEGYLQTHPHHSSEGRAPVQTGSYGLRVLLRELSKHSLRLHTAPSPNPSQIGLLGERPMTAPATTQVTLETEHLTPAISSESRLTLASQTPSFPWFLLPDFNIGAPWPYIILQVLSYPGNIIFNLTIPNRERAIEYGDHSASFYNAFTFQLTGLALVDEQFSDYNFAKDTLLFKVQIFCSTLFFLFHYFYDLDNFYLYLVIFMALSAALIMSVPLAEPRYECRLGRYRAVNYIGSCIGFILSVLWISIFATEIVAILKALSLVFNMSESILGVTVFAFGNSIGDLVSNLTIASMGMPVMAFSACFGGPLLSLCSLGVSCIMHMSHTKASAIPVQFTSTLKLNVFSLFLALVFIATFVPRNGWRFDRWVGASLIGIWMFALIASIALESSA